MQGDIRIRQLRWLCRRGMKELDVLLERFLAEHEDALRSGAWPDLEQLLAEEDDQLWRWVLRPGTRSAYIELLDAICRRA
jgi:antitoxin CptB